MSYCNGGCKYLNKKKKKCELTGEGLTVLKVRGAISYTVYEHTGNCEEKNKTQEETK